MALTADVVVAGGGAIGLCSALALAEWRLNVIVVGTPSTGEASRAAAGMLAPSVERSSAEPNIVGIAARDRYPSYLEYLRERTGISVALNRRGILQVALSAKGVKGLRRSQAPASEWLDQNELARLEPSLSHARGAVHNPLDGSVDNAALMDALTAAAQRSSHIAFRTGRVLRATAVQGSAVAITDNGESISGGYVVIAAGAWSGTIDGVPLARAVTPVKGQLIEFGSAPLSHVVYGPSGYLVPRGASTIGGSTMEKTGFESAISKSGIARVRAAATEICPALAPLDIKTSWAGLRPVTPDLLPLIGPDPGNPSLLYACGHGRNGILMAPLTGDLVADLVTGSPLPYDLAQFRPDRF